MNIDTLIEDQKDDIINSLIELIKIKSVRSVPLPDKPFGQGVSDALKYMEKLSKSMGFSVKNYDGYALEVEYGQGAKKGYILTHLDVVPEGEGWLFPPYEGKIIDDTIYGRGCIDNKGPAISVLYALKAIKDAGVELDNTVRLIFGTAEETGMDCIKYYIEKAGYPDWGLSPDNVYPLVNAEMGIMVFKFVKQFYKNTQISDGVKVITIKGGDAANSVPDFCEALCEINRFYEKEFIDKFEQYKKESGKNIRVEKCENRYSIKSYGLTSHGGVPQNGINAISPVIGFLDSISSDNCISNLAVFLKFINTFIGYELDGESLGIKADDGITGHTIVNLGICNIFEEQGEVTVNVRYPINANGVELIDKLKNLSNKSGIEITVVNNSEPHYVDEKSEFIKNLQCVYTEVTGKEAKLLSSSGGTYARLLGNKAVAFGPCELGSVASGNGHKANEYISIRELMTNTKIYAKVIYKLCGI
jgi:succinyl-diaminopimelate desuccinylase